MPDLLFKIALIGAAGIGAQLLAWRIRVPAIALLLAAGFLLGPALGLINPKEDFGDLFKPVIGLAVAIILFEGGLTLNFKEIRETSLAVRRIVVLGGPLVWLLSTLAAHYGGGLSWPTSAILGAILVITGPTVIIPLLRQAQLAKRPASLLRWEAIVNDPIGALFAVIAFELFLVFHGAHSINSLIVTILVAAALAVVGGYLAGRGLAMGFIRGFVPEYLKAPTILVVVLLVYAISDAVLEESGLLTVTVMGITLANSRIASLTEMRRFKETVTILLVSGLFIMLTASFDVAELQRLGWRAVIFVLLILFVVRPIAILLATTGAGLEWRERLLICWIAPRGIVAVAVSGLFGSALLENGVSDGGKMTALAFVVVVSTIILHGFSLAPLARWLGLRSAERPGILVVGGSGFTGAMSQKLAQMDVDVLVADSNWNHLTDLRMNNVPVWFGEILSERAHHDIALNRFSHLIAASDNDAYNSLVCTEFGPEIGRGNVFQIGTAKEASERDSLSFTLGGRPLFKPARNFSDLRRDIWRDWEFRSTTLSKEFTFEDWHAINDDQVNVLLWVSRDGKIIFAHGQQNPEPGAGDTLLTFGPPQSKDAEPETAETNTQ